MTAEQYARIKAQDPRYRGNLGAMMFRKPIATYTRNPFLALQQVLPLYRDRRRKRPKLT